MEQKFRVFSSAAAGMSLFVSEKAGLIHEGREGSCAKKQIIIRNAWSNWRCHTGNKAADHRRTIAQNFHRQLP